MTEKNKALEIARNLNRTLSNLIETVGRGDSALRDNAIWAQTKPSKAILKEKLNKICKKHNIKEEEL
tara:strand:+ start:409 stop:609 length:201 start_codon:yes stop_codon:yes gene_type:complete